MLSHYDKIFGFWVQNFNPEEVIRIFLLINFQAVREVPLKYEIALWCLLGSRCYMRVHR